MKVRLSTRLLDCWERCPTCKGRGTVVKDGPHPDEHDSRYPCWRCTTDRTQLVGTGWVTGGEDA